MFVGPQYGTFLATRIPSWLHQSRNAVGQDQEFWMTYGVNNTLRNDASYIIKHCLCGQFFKTRRN